MTGKVVVEEVSPGAIFFVDSRQFEFGVYRYDERMANAMLCYGSTPRGEFEPEKEHKKEVIPEAKP